MLQRSLPSIRPSYQSLISVFQQGGVLFAAAVPTPKVATDARTKTASSRVLTMFRGEWITRND